METEASPNTQPAYDPVDQRLFCFVARCWSAEQTRGVLCMAQDTELSFEGLPPGTELLPYDQATVDRPISSLSNQVLRAAHLIIVRDCQSGALSVWKDRMGPNHVQVTPHQARKLVIQHLDTISQQV